MIRIALFAGLFLLATVVPASAQSSQMVQASRKLTRTTLPETYAGRQIVVGSGGGFTGLITTYYLLDNGQLYRKTSRDASYRFISTQKPAATKRMFSTAENQCRIKTTRFDKPGNVSRFVGWRKGRQSYRVTWASGDSTVPASYPKFYNTFMAMIPASARSN